MAPARSFRRQPEGPARDVARGDGNPRPPRGGRARSTRPTPAAPVIGADGSEGPLLSLRPCWSTATTVWLRSSASIPKITISTVSLCCRVTGPIGEHYSVGATPRSYQATPVGPSIPGEPAGHCPLVVLFGEHGTDQANDGVAVGAPLCQAARVTRAGDAPAASRSMARCTAPARWRMRHRRASAGVFPSERFLSR